MKCYIFSIGEPTTNLCVELMESYGFDVTLFQDDTTLWEKLKRFYTEASESEDRYFMRIDADIIPNANVKKLQHNLSLWTCASGYDWYKQDRGAISIHVMNRSIINKCLEHIDEAKDKIRPETYLWRLDDINRHTVIEESYSCGLHGYGQKSHRERIKTLKYNRDQKYDWDLIEKIEAL